MESKTDALTQPPLEELVLGIVDRYAADVPYHPWSNERYRWRERLPLRSEHSTHFPLDSPLVTGDSTLYPMQSRLFRRR